jgi:hypothetical protein
MRIIKAAFAAACIGALSGCAPSHDEQVDACQRQALDKLAYVPVTAKGHCSATNTEYGLGRFSVDVRSPRLFDLTEPRSNFGTPDGEQATGELRRAITDCPSAESGDPDDTAFSLTLTWLRGKGSVSMPFTSRDVDSMRSDPQHFSPLVLRYAEDLGRRQIETHARRSCEIDPGL